MEISGTALVTGASRGIGRSVALELADRGFATVATMRNPEDGADLADATRGRLTVARLDVTDPDTYDLPGDLRVVVNNAGVDSDYLPVEHGNLEDWRTLFETNVLGVVGVITAAIPILRANRPGVICNISSSSILASVPFYSAYRATKAAVSALGDSLQGGARTIRHTDGGDPPRPSGHRHVPAEHRRAGCHPIRRVPPDG